MLCDDMKAYILTLLTSKVYSMTTVSGSNQYTDPNLQQRCLKELIHSRHFDMSLLE